MPLINQPNVTLGDIATNPYLSFERQWIGFDLVIQNGTSVLYAPKSSFNFTFDTASRPPVTENSVIPFVYSDWDGGSILSTGGLPATGDILNNGYGNNSYFGSGSSIANLKPNTPYWYLMAWNIIAGTRLAITKQAFHLNLIENAALAIAPSGDRKTTGVQSNYPGMTQGLKLHSGGYWEDNSIIEIPSHPESMTFMGAEFKIATPLVSGLPGNETASISTVNMELSVYAEVREIIGV